VKSPLPTLAAAMKAADKNPPIGVTQGGSSRKSSGCRPAATNAETKTKEFNYRGLGLRPAFDPGEWNGS